MSSTTMTPSGSLSALPVELLHELFRRQPVLAGLSLALLTLIPSTLIAMALDPRMLAGVSVWAKPLKFEIALFIYTATLAWFAGWLPETIRQRGWHHGLIWIAGFSIVAEMIWLIGAAANGIPSHFNSANLLMAALYPLMGLLAIIVTSVTLIYGVQILRHGSSALHPTFRLSVVLGLVLTFVLTVLAAGFISVWNSHFVGGNLSNAESMPLMGWARDGGDLRVAHFFATHAMHFIPAFGLLASHVLNERQGRAAVIVFAALFVLFVGFTLGQALLGQPFLPMIR